jgi:hypothetical protein
MGGFFLRKWYLDAADEQGNVYIGYWAALQWQKLSLHFYQHLCHTTEKGVHVESGLTRQVEPRWLGSDQLVWQTADVNASWYSNAEPLEATLLDNEKGKLHWHCLQPKAHVRVELPFVSFWGYGYTESLEVSIPPWQFPFDTLYWGRSHSENHYLVWIKLEGESPISFTWHNGEAKKELSITEEAICGKDFQLKLTRKTSLRQGQIGSTVLKDFSNFFHYFPAKALGIYEQKFYGQGQLITKNSLEKATTIYERVHW